MLAEIRSTKHSTVAYCSSSM